MNLWFPGLIWLASIQYYEGLELGVSDRVRYHPLGSNVTIYCTDQFSGDLDWLKGPEGQSHLSACNLPKPCLPSGQKYTVDPKNRRFNLNLYNLNYSDCGTYWCKNHDNRQSHKLELTERINKIELHESDGKVSVSTGCVSPGFTVEIRWYYSYQDGTPRLYDKPATRVEERGGCRGVCGENNAVKVSSILQLFTGLKHAIPVRIIAYVQQGGEVRRMISRKKYFIEGYPPSGSNNAILAFLCVIFSLNIFHMSTMVYRCIRDRSTFKDDGHIYRMCIGGITFTVCLLEIILLCQEEQWLPDNCQSKSAVRYLVTVCGYFFITLAGILPEGRRIYVTLVKRPVKSVIRRDPEGQNTDSTISGVDAAQAQPQETDVLLTREQGTNENEVSDVEAQPHGTKAMLTQEQLTTGNGVQRIRVKLGEDAHLRVTNDTNRQYPVWGRWRPFNVELHTQLYEDNLEWGSDKASLILRKCQQTAEGWYEAFAGSIRIKRFYVEVTGKLDQNDQNVKDLLVDAGTTVSLEGPSTNDSYPSWEYVDAGVYNVGGEYWFQSSEATQNPNKRWNWDNNKRTLNIHNTCKQDEGTYICRLSDGTNTCIRLKVKEKEVLEKAPVITRRFLNAGVNAGKSVLKAVGIRGKN